MKFDPIQPDPISSGLQKTHMEKENNKKRGRDQKAKKIRKNSSNKAKKQLKYNDESDQNNNFCYEDSSRCDDNYMELGVFDFPWLHEGMMSSSKSDELWNFQDDFSTSLINELASCNNNNNNYNNNSCSNMEFATEDQAFIEHKFDEGNMNEICPLKENDLEHEHKHDCKDGLDQTDESDCIWSSLQPIHQDV